MPAERIEQIISVVRGHRVMLDADLAELYGVEVKELKRQVRRNRDRFPADFVLELSQEEQRALRRQFGTLKRGEYRADEQRSVVAPKCSEQAGQRLRG